MQVKHLLRFFSPWPPSRVVWPNYELVLFQPQSGTAPSLGFTANITSNLNPASLFNFLLGHYPSLSMSWPPPSPPTQPVDWSAPLFYHPIISLLFWSLIAYPPGQASNSDNLHFSSCAICLSDLNLLPRSLSYPSPPRCDLVSAVSSPVKCYSA